MVWGRMTVILLTIEAGWWVHGDSLQNLIYFVYNTWNLPQQKAYKKGGGLISESFYLIKKQDNLIYYPNWNR